MAGNQEQSKSWILSKSLDVVFGTKETIHFRRTAAVIHDYITDNHIIFTGSRGEGIPLEGSDIDRMQVIEDVIVLYPENYHSFAKDILHKTIFFIREADCQPCYVNLELAKKGYNMEAVIQHSCVPYQHSIFISSDIYRDSLISLLSRQYGQKLEINGPCWTMFRDIGSVVKCDATLSFPCLNWPREARDWISRTRLYGWPPPDLINTILQGGCHVVAVGDKSSEDTFLQWRLSFATAERRLVFSLTHLQIKIYALMKLLLKQTQGLLKILTGEDDILCSYFIKTLIFYAVEHSPQSLWQERNIFTCFMFCFNMLIDWVKSGYCPHYFIPTNNLFLRKVRGRVQQTIFQILIEIRDKKWECLFEIGGQSIAAKTIRRLLTDSMFRCLVFSDEIAREFDADMRMYDAAMYTHFQAKTLYNKAENEIIIRKARLVLSSETEFDEFMSYIFFSRRLSKVAKIHYKPKQTSSGGNKRNYSNVKRCENLLLLGSSFSPGEGKLTLATFYYVTGNYRRTLRVCEQMNSAFIFLSEPMKDQESAKYANKCCGKGYGVLKKSESVAYSAIIMSDFCPNELLYEITKEPSRFSLRVPTKQYILFLTFMCHHRLGNTSKRNESLQSLHDLCYSSDGQIPRHYCWSGFVLLGICYQTIGAYPMAIKAFRDTGEDLTRHRIAVVYLLMCYQMLKH